MEEKVVSSPQCQFFVLRKKRLCRMTVRPGRQYCGEHEPQPTTEDGLADNRIPCPNDPKHTCYVSKLEKHLSICNARQVERPAYIVPNINAPLEGDTSPRKPLAEVSRECLMQLIDKVNLLYEKYVQDSITTFPEYPIHSVVLADFNESNRTESSRRHLRQVSSLLWIIEKEELVQDQACYVELGAGKGQVSQYAAAAWCGAGAGRVLLVDRAALRHKRDGRVARALGGGGAVAGAAGAAARLRADLRHLALRRVPLARRAPLVGLAKHLCGAATDYAIRCMVNVHEEDETTNGAKCEPGSGPAARCGIVVAACCHHRADRATYVARSHLMELGINDEDMDIMLGIVSWATCGDGRSRDKRKVDQTTGDEDDRADHQPQDSHQLQDNGQNGYTQDITAGDKKLRTSSKTSHENNVQVKEKMSQQYREVVGRRTKALLDWGRVLYLREKGFDARLCYYVPTSVSLENLCIIAKKVINIESAT
ncbi:tRNA:m(4)X modification enzyme TRM13 homolog [Achroia grisella]|uniref:tRNA:m(4)X modification enzyme TRM13 homolog n=1 Tax=Achroia grisella TaxID=688607 RepID=UPI0027D2B52D|nr:tRNA:m(4)X modification enzyme TRM13 homolog [Achroia grisella]